MTEPRTSILLPAHNRGDLIGYSIRSVLWQTDGDFELLVVGDGCTDNTAEVVASFSDPRVRWFDLPKAPFAGYANRNHVLRQARGRYVAYAQDDDIMLPDHLERLIGTLEESDAEWGYSRPLWVGHDGFISPSAVDLTQQDQLDFFLNRTNTIPSCCVAHTRDALERVGYWPEDVERAGDWVCWRRIIETGAPGKVAYCRAPTVLHFQADWRASNGPEERMRAIAASGSWWPAAFRIPVVPGGAEQVSAFEEIAEDPTAWMARLRRGVEGMVDRLAWGVVLPRMKTWPDPPKEARQAQAQERRLVEARRRIKKLKQANARLERNWASPRALVRQFWRLLFPRRRR